MSRRAVSTVGGTLVLLAVLTGLSVLVSRSQPATATAGIAPKSEPPPKAVLDDELYDFGVMDVGATGRHTFVLRNEGAGPLTIHPGGTSCKCTLLDAPDGTVPPGESRDLRLEWTAAQAVEHFRHGAVLWTNDPDRRQIHLVVAGKVRTHLGQWPETVAFTDLLRDETRTQTVTIYSQTYANMSIADVACSDEHLAWSIRPASAQTLVHLNAESAWDIDVTVSPGHELGTHWPKLRVWIDAGEDQPADEPKFCDVELPCEVVSDFSIYGAKVQGTSLKLGAVERGQGAQATAWLYVRGPHTEVTIEDIRSQPDLVDVKITRDTAATGKTARYRIEASIPPDAPPIDCMGPRAAKVELVTDHPTLPTVHFDVEFAIVE